MTGIAHDEAVGAAIATSTSETNRLNSSIQAWRYADWSRLHPLQSLPASSADVARYLAGRFRAGAKMTNIGALYSSAGNPRPTDAEVVRKTVRDLSREAANAARRRARALTAEHFAAIPATVSLPKKYSPTTGDNYFSIDSCATN